MPSEKTQTYKKKHYNEAQFYYRTGYVMLSNILNKLTLILTICFASNILLAGQSNGDTVNVVLDMHSRAQLIKITGSSAKKIFDNLSDVPRTLSTESITFSFNFSNSQSSSLNRNKTTRVGENITCTYTSGDPDSSAECSMMILPDGTAWSIQFED